MMASLGETVAALAANRWSPRNQDEQTTQFSEVQAFGQNPGALRMLVHVPAARAGKAPLVVVLHGCTQTGPGYADGAGWTEMADRCGFVVLCPEQTRANNPNLCFNWFQPGDVARGAGEAASIHAMIVRAILDYDLDPRRVFITGLSAGGAMANAMLATYPEVFAGGAIVAGLPYGAASNMQEAFAAMRNGRSSSPEAWGDAVRAASTHGGPWPRISIWQGDEDATVKAGVADDLVRQWIDVHGLESATGERVTTGRRRRTVWRGRDGAAAVELNRIDGMGHGAPLGCSLADGCGTEGAYLLEVGVSSTLEITQFWGLLGSSTACRPAKRATPAAFDVGALKPVSQTEPLPSRMASGIEGVITDALRSAGLIKSP